MLSCLIEIFVIHDNHGDIRVQLWNLTYIWPSDQGGGGDVSECLATPVTTARRIVWHYNSTAPMAANSRLSWYLQIIIQAGGYALIVRSCYDYWECNLLA